MLNVLYGIAATVVAGVFMLLFILSLKKKIKHVTQVRLMSKVTTALTKEIERNPFYKGKAPEMFLKVSEVERRNRALLVYVKSFDLTKGLDSRSAEPVTVLHFMIGSDRAEHCFLDHVRKQSCRIDGKSFSYLLEQALGIVRNFTPKNDMQPVV